MVGTTVSKTEEVFFTARLPELAHPRHRQGGIREPQNKLFYVMGIQIHVLL